MLITLNYEAQRGAVKSCKKWFLPWGSMLEPQVFFSSRPQAQPRPGLRCSLGHSKRKGTGHNVVSSTSRRPFGLTAFSLVSRCWNKHHFLSLQYCTRQILHPTSAVPTRVMFWSLTQHSDSHAYLGHLSTEKDTGQEHGLLAEYFQEFLLCGSTPDTWGLSPLSFPQLGDHSGTRWYTRQAGMETALASELHASCSDTSWNNSISKVCPAPHQGCSERKSHRDQQRPSAEAHPVSRAPACSDGIYNQETFYHKQFYLATKGNIYLVPRETEVLLPIIHNYNLWLIPSHRN